jgi:hypothetical protein
LAQAPHPLVERALLEMFRRVLDEAGDNDPPHPTGEARLEYAVWDDTYRLTVPFRMPDGRVLDYHTAIAASAIMRVRGDRPTFTTPVAISSMWSSCYEDHYMRRMERAARGAMATAPDYRTYEMRQHAWEQIREQTLNFHDSPFIMLDEDTSRETATQVRHRQEIVGRHVRSVSRRVEEHLFQAAFGGSTSTVGNAAGELTLDSIRPAMEILSQNNVPDWRAAFVHYQNRIAADWDRFSEDLALYGSAAMFVGAPEVGTKEAQARGLQLLNENLTPEQLASYEKNKHFDVKGGETGKTYRIRHGRQMNITELDANGNRACGWCFLPQGALVSGDCMLAQKTALELFEGEALKIANRFV